MINIFIVGLSILVLYVAYQHLFAVDTKKLEAPATAEEVLPYEKKPYLMTNAERNFFKVLYEAAHEKYYIVPQVPLSNIVRVEYTHRWFYEYRNKINRRYLDFVLFDKEYFTPQIVIELDDTTHLLPDRAARDVFVDKVLQKAGIRVVHIKTAYSYDIQSIFN